ncbi:MAG TPA: 50S ribosomal protein L22 [Euryarchaeota archaeon]|nr:50S ribosomal protein L22 [Euryarchaeota archaeon]
MPHFGYSIPEEKLSKRKIAKARANDLRISPKHAREICDVIRGMSLSKAKAFLEDVISMKRPVPFKRHKKKVGHRRGLEGWFAGRYPVKAAKEILKVLENLEANADYKGLDTDRLKIIHISAHRGPVIRGIIPRAFGRATPFNTPLTHIEVIAEEV